ncbi:helix-turn-helix domain-containing protein [Corynebacterium timonense]|uniref:helix-turn-helix domain-containing protein n=1 Tax=Corynebacterium timonense TaxID=441500 RepID=UPI0009DAC588
MRRDPSRRWRISELAAMVSLSPSALHRAFTQDVGMSPFTWLGRARTAEMARLLRESDGSVETIGRQVGWKNRGHATRQFKATVGMSPSNYRRTAIARSLTGTSQWPSAAQGSPES